MQHPSHSVREIECGRLQLQKARRLGQVAGGSSKRQDDAGSTHIVLDRKLSDLSNRRSDICHTTRREIGDDDSAPRKWSFDGKPRQMAGFSHLFAELAAAKVHRPRNLASRAGTLVVRPKPHRQGVRRVPLQCRHRAARMATSGQAGVRIARRGSFAGNEPAVTNNLLVSALGLEPRTY